MSKRCRLTADRWRELIERQRSSGLSVKAFCRREGVAVSMFFAWRRKLRVAPTFVELTGEVEATDASDSTDGHDAEASGFYSLTASAKRHGLDPFVYLRDVLATIGSTPANQLDPFLPDRWRDRQLEEIAAG